MKTINTGGPAFPKVGAVGANNEQLSDDFTGITKRTYIATKILCAFLSNPASNEENADKSGKDLLRMILENSFYIADKMIAEEEGNERK